MQCPNCEFNNLPGLTVCARCGSPLEHADVDVVPLRAGAGRIEARSSRSWYALLRGWRGADDWVRTFVFQPENALPLGTALWGLVPGMGHARMGQRAIGCGFLFLWLLTLFFMLMSLGTVFAGFLFYCLIALHTFTFGLLLAPTLAADRWHVRALAGLVVFGILWLVLYLPADALASRHCFLVPEDSPSQSGPIHRGDGFVLWGGTFGRGYRRGDLVVFRVDEYRHEGIIIHPGRDVDRIVGLPGEHLDLTDGVLRINGQVAPPEAQPLDGFGGMINFTLDLGPGEYAIFPTSLRPRVPHTDELLDLAREAIRRINAVPRSRILGRVVFRLHPWSRLGPVK